MDIRKLTFFTTIVDHAYNLTRASKHLHISQPALSQLVREFEELEQVELFLRHHGRLTGLTDAGQQFYEDALSVLRGHQQMMEQKETHLDVSRVRCCQKVDGRHLNHNHDNTTNNKIGFSNGIEWFDIKQSI